MTRLARLALSLLAMLALLVARPSTSIASTRAALDACTDLVPLAAHHAAASTPVSPGCAERSPSSASASTAKGETDGAQRALAREHRRVGASNTQKNPHYSGNAMPDQLPEDGFVYFYHPDHLGSTSYVTDAAGDVYEHTGYFPHGETWIDQANSSEALPYLFTSKELDQETGLYYFGARYYDPQTALWQSADPIDPRWGNPRTLNLYHYSLHNPLTIHDPDGREERAAFQAGMALWARALDSADRPAPTNTGGGAFFGGLARNLMRTVVAAPDAMVAEATAAIQATAESGPGSMVQPLWSMMTAPANTVVNAATDVVDVGRGAVAAATMGGSDEEAGAAAAAPVIGAMKVAATVLGLKGADKVRGAAGSATGEFSVTDWKGYPVGGPRPTGPFRLIEGAEYDAARKAANQANAALRRLNPEKYAGKQIHEVHPVKYGGSPTDPSNKVAVSPTEHAQYTTFWNRLMRDIQ